MEIYFINSDEFLKYINQESLNCFLEDKNFKSQKQKIQFCLGRFLVKYIGVKKYNIQNPEIEIVNKKPKFIHSNIKFSISHSKNIILAAFDENNIGVDIEEMKPRNYDDIFKYFKINQKNISKEYFYRFWTELEAKIKLQTEPKSSITFMIDNFMLTVMSDYSFDINSKLKIYEVKSPTANTNPNELINLKPVNASNVNENTLVIQDINTASLTRFSPLNLNIE